MGNPSIPSVHENATMKKHLIPALIFAAAGCSILSGAVFAAGVNGQCTLKYGDATVGKGPCKIIQKGAEVTIKGSVGDNDRRYSAVINNDTGEGLLIGAGVFPLADGKLLQNDANTVKWPNGYKLQIRM